VQPPQKTGAFVLYSSKSHYVEPQKTEIVMCDMSLLFVTSAVNIGDFTFSIRNFLNKCLCLCRNLSETCTVGCCAGLSMLIRCVFVNTHIHTEETDRQTDRERERENKRN
jgi:hypothetical protein